MRIYFIMMVIPFLSQGEEVGSKEERYSNIVEEIKRSHRNVELQDYSQVTTEELVDIALRVLPDRRLFEKVGEELSLRGAEFREIMLREAESIYTGEDYSMRKFLALPVICGAVDADLGAEVSKRILFNESLRRFDEYNIQQGYLMRFIGNSSQDETVVIEKLIMQGRLLKGSKEEIKWSKVFKGGKHGVDYNFRTMSDGNIRGVGSHDDGKAISEKEEVSKVWMVAISLGVTTCVGLLYLRRNKIT